MFYRLLPHKMSLVIIIGLIALIFSFPQEGLAQKEVNRRLSSQEFQVQFIEAFVMHDNAKMNALVERHRDLVRTVVTRFLDESLEEDIKGEIPEAERNLAVATVLADIYNDISRDDIALRKVEFYKRLSKEEKKQKCKGDAFFCEAHIALRRANFKKAIKKGYHALNIYELLRDCEGQIDALQILGTASRKLANYEKAFSFFEQALELAQRRNDRLGIGVALIEIGDVYERKKELAIAMEYYERAVNTLRIPDDWRELGRVHCQLGDVYVDLGEFETTYRHYRKALQYAEIYDDKRYKAKYLDYIGYFYRRLGDYEEAIHCHTSALESAECIEDGELKAQAKARAFNHRGLTYIELGNAEVDFKTAGLHDTSGSTLREELGIREFSEKTQQIAEEFYHKALSDENQALENANEADDQIRKGYVLRAISLIYEKLGEITTGDNRIKNYEAGLRYSQVAFDEPASVEWKGLALHNMGQALSGLGKFQESFNAFQEALKIWKDIGDTKEEATAYCYIGYYVYEKSDKVQEAIISYRRALNLFQVLGASTDFVVATYLSIGGLLERAGKTDGAIEAYTASIAALEAMRRGFKKEKHKTTFFEARFNPYESLFKLQMSLHEKDKNKEHDRKGFQTAEKMKARIFLDQLSEVRAKRFGGLPEHALSKERGLTNRLIKLEDNLIKERAKPEAKQNKDFIIRLEEEKNSHESELNNLKKELEEKYPRYAALKYPEPLTLESLQKEVLEDGEVIVEYMVTDEKTYIFVVTNKRFKAYSVNIGQKALSEMVAKLTSIPQKIINTIGSPARTIKKTRPEWRKVGSKIYDAFVKPVENDIKSSRHIFIIPDEDLYYVPFEALSKGATEDEYMIERYTISYLPSSSVLNIIRAAKSKAPPKYPLLAFAHPLYPQDGNINTILSDTAIKGLVIRFYSNLGSIFPPLPETREEAEQIAKMLELNKDDLDKFLYIQRRATETNIKKLSESEALKDYRYIIFSAHGILGGEVSQVMQPAIVLSLGLPEEKEDGFLQMGEVFGLEMNSDLVTLSACKTGLGEKRKGEGIVGLSRAFFYAGTPSINVTLWSIESESAKETTTGMYRNLKEGKNKAEALRQSKIDLLRNKENSLYSHPFFWAPFILIGDYK